MTRHSHGLPRVEDPKLLLGFSVCAQPAINRQVLIVPKHLASHAMRRNVNGLREGAVIKWQRDLREVVHSGFVPAGVS